jgi:hypothetical protein
MAGVERTRHQAFALATDIVKNIDSTNRYRYPPRSTAALIEVDALHQSADTNTCEAVLSEIKSVTVRAEALARLSGLCRASDSGAADRLFASAVDIARQVKNTGRRVQALATVAQAAGPLSPSTPGMSQLVATAKRALEKIAGPTRVELGASMTISLWNACCADYARDFASIARGVTDDMVSEEARYELCAALACLRDYSTALSLAHGNRFIEQDIADIAADNADFAVASDIGQQLVEASTDAYFDHETSGLLNTLLRTQQPDLAMSVFMDQRHNEGELIAYDFFRKLVTTGHAHESLIATRKIDIHKVRIAALIGWASAPTWPQDVRARNLRLLKVSAIDAFRW